MPAFLVHGVPNTARMWDGLRAQLTRTDVLAPSLPGFGTKPPAGWGATKEEYADWLTHELERLGEPVDLVGHDWGSILVQRVAGARPDLIRTWACGGGPVDTDYVWHEMAKLWQTPEVGEQVMEAMTPDALELALGPELGAEHVRLMAGSIDDTMKTCILALYRSAVNVGAEWEDDVARGASTRPGLVLWGRDDPYVSASMAERLAKRTGATCVIFDDAAHWWPVTRAEESARHLEALWNSV
jgi:pimeloyl-ACP methyl ester carboxylesterase